jgi:hypothetical protein
MSDLESIGDVVTGSLVAHAVEPATGEGDGRMRDGHCANCGSALVGPYCHECGQQARVHRTLGALVYDLTHGLLNVEGKIFRTLPMLALKPGDLTRRYIAGERARFVSPLALFLFSVFFFFAVIQVLGNPVHFNDFDTDQQTYRSTDEAIAGSKQKLAKLEREFAASSGEKRQGIAEDIADEKKALETLERIRKDGIGNAVLAETSASTGMSTQSDLPIINQAIDRVKKNPQLALYKLQDATSKFAWALIPISVPFMWLLFPFSRRFRLYDHTVFVAYSLSFMLFLAALLSMWGAAGLSGVALAAIFIPPVHMYRQLKQAYGLSWVSALLRTAALLLFALISVGLFAALVALVGMSG